MSDPEEPVTIVTKAKYVDEGKRVVVALVGASIGDPEDGNVVTKRSVGGVMSEGMEDMRFSHAKMVRWCCRTGRLLSSRRVCAWVKTSICASPWREIVIAY